MRPIHIALRPADHGGFDGIAGGDEQLGDRRHAKAHGRARRRGGDGRSGADVEQLAVIGAGAAGADVVQVGQRRRRRVEQDGRWRADLAGILREVVVGLPRRADARRREIHGCEQAVRGAGVRQGGPDHGGDVRVGGQRVEGRPEVAGLHGIAGGVGVPRQAGRPDALHVDRVAAERRRGSAPHPPGALGHGRSHGRLVDAAVRQQPKLHADRVERRRPDRPAPCFDCGARLSNQHVLTAFYRAGGGSWSLLQLSLIHI